MPSGRSPAWRLLDIVDRSGTDGVSFEEARDLLGVSSDVLGDLIRRMLAADRAWLDRDTGRLFSTAPFLL